MVGDPSLLKWWTSVDIPFPTSTCPLPLLLFILTALRFTWFYFSLPFDLHCIWNRCNLYCYFWFTLVSLLLLILLLLFTGFAFPVTLRVLFISNSIWLHLTLLYLYIWLRPNFVELDGIDQSYLKWIWHPVGFWGPFCRSFLTTNWEQRKTKFCWEVLPTEGAEIWNDRSRLKRFLEMVVQIGAPFEYQQPELQSPETCVGNVSQRLQPCLKGKWPFNV